MRGFWRPLALAAALTATVLAGSAAAQKVTVTKAPPGASVQLVLDATPIATATADSGGIATLDVDLQKHVQKAESDVRIFVDFCGESRRVTLIETGYEIDQPAASCVRREIFGTFYLTQVTTLVVRMAEDAPVVWISQGPAPRSWLGDQVAGGSAEETGSALQVPNGFHVFAGGGLGRYSNFVDLSCGIGTSCSGKQTRLAGQLGLDFWFTRNLAFQAFYLRSTSPATAGGGSGYTFTGSLTSNVAVITAKVGLPYGKTRLYVQGGGTYTWATATTTETTADRTYTLNGVTQTIPGGTQTLTFKTTGLGWTISGGTEYWAKRWMALYVEFGRAGLQGSATDNGQGALDDAMLYGVAGLRFRLVGSR